MINLRKPLVFALLSLSGSKIPKNLKEISILSRLSEDEAKKYQEEKLKRLLLYSYNNVPYYNRILKKAGVVRDNKVYLENFEKIPILTKDIIRKEGKNLYSKEKRKGVYENTSGGSTGEPVRFLQDKVYDDWNKANKIWYKLVAGQGVGERELRFWGSERDLLEGRESFMIRVRNSLYNRREFNTFKMSEKEMLEYVEKWNKYNPSWVESYVQSIYEFAKFIEKRKLEIKSPKNGILTSAGTLYPEMKETIERVFGCKVYNRYGSREVGDIACGLDELNISFWNQKVEINNKSRKVYVTNLNNYSMPLIRYDIGDMAEFGKNEFEFGRVLGREMSMFKTKRGKIIPAEFFIHFIGVVYNNGSLSKFQVIQKDYDYILIKAILNSKDLFNKIKRDIEKSIRVEMGKDCKIKWEFVKDIRPLKSGKYEYTRSEVR